MSSSLSDILSGSTISFYADFVTKKSEIHYRNDQKKKSLDTSFRFSVSIHYDFRSLLSLYYQTEIRLSDIMDFYNIIYNCQ